MYKGVSVSMYLCDAARHLFQDGAYQEQNGAGSALTSAQMIGYVVFWTVTCFFLVIPVWKMKSLDTQN